uniref:Uncharacterized protein n=1 Tax=Cacopsylla melanoneura TaxID=428564 RepID=A0A8D9BHF0_9HEMI
MMGNVYQAALNEQEVAFLFFRQDINGGAGHFSVGGLSVGLHRVSKEPMRVVVFHRRRARDADRHVFFEQIRVLKAVKQSVTGRRARPPEYCGISRVSMCVRTMGMEWERVLSDLAPVLRTIQEETMFQAYGLMAWTC